MLELLMSSGQTVDPLVFTVNRNDVSIDSGMVSGFDIHTTGGATGASYTWKLTGDGVPYVISATEGSFTIGNDPTAVVFETRFDESFTDEFDITLTIETLNGRELVVSDPIAVVYTAHPIGQQDFVTVGTYDFVVPEGVTQLATVSVGGGQGSYDAPRGRGGYGGALRWRNYIEVTPGETLTIIVGAGGRMSTDIAVRNGGDTELRRGDEALLRAAGGGRDTSTEISIVKDGDNWDIPLSGYVVGGGDGGVPAAATEGNGPSGGGGAGGYLGNGGRSGDRVTNASDGAYRSGAPGGGAYYYTASNDSHHATAGGGVGLRGLGSTGVAGIRNDAMAGGKGGSGGQDGTWIVAGLYGAGAKGRSSNSAFGSVNGANGALRLIWGYGRRYPRTKTDNL